MYGGYKFKFKNNNFMPQCTSHTGVQQECYNRP